MISNFIQFFKQNEADIVLVIGIILISLISFGGGWLLGSSPNLVAEQDIEIEEVPLGKLQASPTKIEGTKESDIQQQEIEENQQKE